MMLETKRLYLKELTDNCLDDLYRLNSNKDVMKYIGKPETKEETRETLRRWLSYNRAHPGLGFWVCCEKETGNFIGWLALKHLGGTAEIEIGWRLLKEYWGRGYATEMARKLIDYGFNKLKLKKIISVTVPENKASQRVMEKLGMIYEKNIIHAGMDHRKYVINNCLR